MPRSLTELEHEYHRLARSLAETGYLTQGSVFERKKGPGSRYQWTWKNREQKTESLTLTLEQYQWLRRATANERKLKKTLMKMRQLSEQVFSRSFNPESKRK
jgi:hypothetical protein